MAWIVAGSAAMIAEGLALADELRTFPTGPAGLAETVMPAVQAMRPLRWPAEHLETLGGYLTFHNVTLFAAFLAIYGAMAGARAIRRGEEQHSLEMILSAGWSRGAVLRDRSIGFLVSMAAITIALAAAVAWTMAAGDAPDLSGSMITMTATGMCAVVAYSWALLLSQFTPTYRSAAGLTVLWLTALYLITNTWENLGPVGALRWLSPFYYANQSRALVPGHGLDVSAMAALVLMAAVLTALACWAFSLRDYGSVVWHHERRARGGGPSMRPSWVAHSMWTHLNRRSRVGVLAWCAGGAAFMALMMGLQPTFVDALSRFDFVADMAGGRADTPLDSMYASFTSEILLPVVAGFLVALSASWVADLDSGRVETILSAPVSWTRLVLERSASAMTGVLVITLVSFGAMAVAGRAVGAEIDSAGMSRAMVTSLIFGAAICGIAVVLVALTRSALAVIALAVYLGGAYLMTTLVPVFHWPGWLNRLSVFDAAGHPYLAWPSLTGTLVLIGLALGGIALGAWIAERSPKVP